MHSGADCHPYRKSRITLPTRATVRQFLRYAAVGATQNGTVLGAVAGALAVGIPLVPATLIGAAAALTLSFTLNRRWTFRDTADRTAERALRYAIVWLAFVATTVPALVVLVKVLDVPRVGAQALIICVGAPISYLLQRRWAFRPSDLEDAGRAGTTPVIAAGADACQGSTSPDQLEAGRRPRPRDGKAAA